MYLFVHNESLLHSPTSYSPTPPFPHSPTQHIVEEGATHKCKVALSTLEQYPDASNPKSLLDKFRVQSVAIDSKTTIEEVATLWKRLESSHKPKEGVILYQEDKIKVKLVVPAMELTVGPPFVHAVPYFSQ